MKTNGILKKIVTTAPPWGLIGAALILLPLLAFVTYEDINRQNAASRRQLLAKGAALIRSFEAGTRAGMMMRQWGNRHLQRLLMETARQPDIIYLMVTDNRGMIIAHSSPDRIKGHHGKDLDIQRVLDAPTEIYRIIETGAGSKNIFEVYRKFRPARGPGRMLGRHHMMMRPFEEEHPGDLIIFVGLDMSEVEKALAADTRHSLFMAAILLLVGFAGVTLLFMTHTYRVTRASLKRIESFSDSLVDNLPVGLISIGADNRIASINPEAGRIFKLKSKQLIGRSALGVLPPQLVEALNALESSQNEIEREVACQIEPGDRITIGLNASAWHDREGTIMGTILLIRDLSEIRALRKEIARSQRLASLGSLAAGVAHEIRNPLSSIKGFATYFKERNGDNPKDLETAAIMIREVERLNRVVGQLLELARPIELAPKNIPLDSLFKSSLALIEAQAAEKQIRIETNLVDDGLSIYADPDRINQVLLNLYLNAIDALEPGRGRLSISARRTTREAGILLTVADNGSGIAKRDQPHIFDPYFTSKSTGTGLGLAIVHNIMEAHGGTISVTSDPGLETTFNLFFPENLEDAPSD